jgi:hypothetical protein
MPLFLQFFRFLEQQFRDHQLEQTGRPDWRKCLFFFPILTPALCLFFGPQYLDDAQITFRVSRNLVEFGVPYYNVGEVVQASTTPLYSLLLAVLYAITSLPPEVVENLLQIPLLIVTLVLLSKISLLIEQLRPYWWLPGFFFSFEPILIVHVKGMEAYLYAVFLLLAIYAELLRKPLLLGVALGLCAVTRTEGAFFALAYLAYWGVLRYWFQEVRQTRELLQSTLAGILTGLPFLAYVITFFGYPIPSSVRGKLHQASFVNLDHFDYIMQYYLVGQFHTYNIWFIPLTAFVLLIFPAILRKKNVARWREFGFPSLAAFGLMSLFYFTNAPGFAWYLYPSAVVFTLIYALCTVYYLEHGIVLFKKLEVKVPWKLLYVLFMIPIIIYGLFMRTRANQILLSYVNSGNFSFMSDVRYAEIAQDLWREYPDPTLSLGSPEIGHLGNNTYYKIIDFSALASPELIEDAGKISYYEMALKHRPDFVVIPEDPLLLRRNPRLKARFQAVYPRSKVYDADHLGQRTVFYKERFF